MDRCAPDYANGTVTCFSDRALRSIINAYNASHTDKIQLTSGARKRDIWEAIQQKMSDKCGKDEACWINQGFLKKLQPDLEQYFKPLAPLGQYQWLSTDDIYNVMSQYDRKHKDFKFVGPLPMDFLRLRDKDSLYLQGLDLNRERSKGLKNIGVIFNMDPSTKGGSHWIALNIDLLRNEIHYFDSYGAKHTEPNEDMLPYYDSYGQYNRGARIPMPKDIQKFVFKTMMRMTGDKGKKAMQVGGKMKMPYKLRINSIQHQYANSECGVYSMLFLLKSRNSSFEQITQDIITDEVANQARNHLFRRK